MKIEQTKSSWVLQLEVEPLLEAHYRELANTAVFELMPDWPVYRSLMASGKLLALLAMDGGQCVGYSVSFIQPHVHYVHQTMAHNDVIFVSKPYRDSTIGGRLLVETERRAKAMGCTGVVYHAKPDTALNRALSKRMPLHEYVYIKAL